MTKAIVYDTWCSRCKAPMRHNVPRLGSAGGFVHAETGKFECADGQMSNVVYQEGCETSAGSVGLNVINNSPKAVDYTNIKVTVRKP